MEENLAHVTSAQGAMNLGFLLSISLSQTTVYLKHKISKSQKQLMQSEEQWFSILVHWGSADLRT